MCAHCSHLSYHSLSYLAVANLDAELADLLADQHGDQPVEGDGEISVRVVDEPQLTSASDTNNTVEQAVPRDGPQSSAADVNNEDVVGDYVNSPESTEQEVTSQLFNCSSATDHSEYQLEEEMETSEFQSVAEDEAMIYELAPPVEFVRETLPGSAVSILADNQLPPPLEHVGADNVMQVLLGEPRQVFSAGLQYPQNGCTAWCRQCMQVLSGDAIPTSQDAPNVATHSRVSGDGCYLCGTCAEHEHSPDSNVSSLLSVSLSEEDFVNEQAPQQ